MFFAVWLLNRHPVVLLHVDALAALELYMVYENILPVWSNGICVMCLVIWSLKLCPCQLEHNIASQPQGRGN